MKPVQFAPTETKNNNLVATSSFKGMSSCRLIFLSTSSALQHNRHICSCNRKTKSLQGRGGKVDGFRIVLANKAEIKILTIFPKTEMRQKSDPPTLQ